MTNDPVWFVVPSGIDDPARVSGGNVYDRRLRTGLERLGWTVRALPVDPDAAASVLEQIPDDGLVLIDGLVALSSPEAVERAAPRLRLIALVHMSVAAFPGHDPAHRDAEARVLRAARRVVVPSAWLRDELADRGLTPGGPAVVARPGADEASVTAESGTGDALLCVGVVAPHKGQDTLIEALAAIGPSAGWSCAFVGAARDRVFAAALAEQAERAGIAGRVRWAGVLEAEALAVEYGRADLLVAPSLTESYGMAVGDALRRGIPVIASAAGGLPEAVQPADAGILVTPGDPAALAAALRRWIAEPELRARMTRAARASGPLRPGWDATARAVDRTLRELR